MGNRNWREFGLGVAATAILIAVVGSCVLVYQTYTQALAVSEVLLKPADREFIIKDADGKQRPATVAEVLEVLVAERVQKFKQQQAQAPMPTPPPTPPAPTPTPKAGGKSP